jgi:hypothetical protein
MRKTIVGRERSSSLGVSEIIIYLTGGMACVRRGNNSSSFSGFHEKIFPLTVLKFGPFP